MDWDYKPNENYPHQIWLSEWDDSELIVTVDVYESNYDKIIEELRDSRDVEHYENETYDQPFALLKRDVRNWLNEHMVSGWEYDDNMGALYIKSDDDAALFKLTWYQEPNNAC